MRFLSHGHLSLKARIKTYHHPLHHLLKNSSKWKCQSPGHTTLLRKAVCSRGFRNSINPDKIVNQHKGFSGQWPPPSYESVGICNKHFGHCPHIPWGYPTLLFIKETTMTIYLNRGHSKVLVTAVLSAIVNIRRDSKRSIREQSCFEARDNWKTEIASFL